MHETLITAAGFDRLNEQLERLRTFGRREATERIRRSFATDADATANHDYQAAREEQALLEVRIERLERRLAATRVGHPDASNDIVDFGERVRLRDLDTGKRLEYELVGTLEADPAAGRISAESPLGRALIGLRKGEVALVDAPRGQRQLRITSIAAASSI
jgi:transcription elongation factor GreA